MRLNGSIPIQYDEVAKMLTKYYFYKDTASNDVYQSISESL